MAKLCRYLESVGRRHRDIEDHNIRGELARQFQRLRTVGCLTAYLVMTGGFQDGAQTAPYKGVIVSKQNPSK